MEAFVKHRGVAVTLDSANVDTDQIIPKQYLKSIKRTGFGPGLFHDWRYLDNGQDNPAFTLNQPRFANASVLVTRNNFGCGSSREHAVWAILQYGFRAVIAPRAVRGEEVVPAFADIFRNNSGKNGLLTVELSEDQVQRIFEAVAAHEGLEVSVDLEDRTVVLHTPDPITFPFEIEEGLRQNLLQGLDPIAQTMVYLADIEAFERGHDVQLVG